MNGFQRLGHRSSPEVVGEFLNFVDARIGNPALRELAQPRIIKGGFAGNVGQISDSPALARIEFLQDKIKDRFFHMLHSKQSLDATSSNTLISAAGNMFRMGDSKKSARAIVAENVRRLMGQQTQKVFGKKCGVSQTGLGYLLRPHNTAMTSPKLDTLEKIAKANDLETWQLLVDPETFGQELAEAMRRPAIGDTNTKLAAWSTKPKRATAKGGR